MPSEMDEAPWFYKWMGIAIGLVWAQGSPPWVGQRLSGVRKASPKITIRFMCHLVWLLSCGMEVGECPIDRNHDVVEELDLPRVE